MSKPPPDTRAPIAIAYAWAWRVITISLEMVIPGLVGLWIDIRVGSLPWLTILGFGLGMTVGMMHLVQIAGAMSKSDSTNDTTTDSDEQR